MQLISLNTWGGLLFKDLAQFIENHKDTTDIFCFQEIFKSDLKPSSKYDFRPNFYSDLKKILNNFQSFYAPSSKNHNLEGKVEFPIYFGLATFVKNKLEVTRNFDEMIFNKRYADVGNAWETLPKNIQISQIKKDGEFYNIFNFHGQWYPGDKMDTKNRINQSNKILKLLKKAPSKKILCGDFNLMPNTKSMQILEEEMVNLIREYKISTTRVRKYQTHPPFQKFADYILVSEDIKVLDFQVLDDDISDHRAMFLEFS